MTDQVSTGTGKKRICHLNGYSNLVGLYFIALIAACTLYNYLFHQAFVAAHGTWAEIVDSLGLFQTLAAAAVPSIERIGTTLVANDYTPRAELVARLYSANWVILLVGLTMILPFFLALKRRIGDEAIVLRKVRLPWFDEADTGPRYALFLARLNTWWYRAAGLAGLAIIATENVAFEGGPLMNVVHASNGDLYRIAVVGGMCLALVLFSFIWSAFGERVRTRGLDDVHFF